MERIEHKPFLFCHFSPKNQRNPNPSRWLEQWRSTWPPYSVRKKIESTVLSTSRSELVAMETDALGSILNQASALPYCSPTCTSVPI